MEVILVVVLMVSVTAFAAPLLGSTASRTDLDAAAEGAVDALREAQSAAMSGRGSGRYGVHFESGKFVLFEGAAYVPGDPGNVEHALSGFVGVTGVSLSGGGNEVLYANHRGTPVQDGTVTFSDSGGETVTVTIGAGGVVEAD